MKTDGLWTLTYRNEDGELPSGGVMVVAGDSVVGGDGYFYWTGTWILNAGKVTARMKSTRFRPGPSLFDGSMTKKGYEVRIEGGFDPRKFVVAIWVNDKKQRGYTAMLEKRA